nr:uncharacterized protein LOC129386065 [Dermacentor andersoni]
MMIKEEGRVDFQTGDVNGVRTVQLKTIEELAPTENAPTEFPHVYVVLRVAKDCLLASYGQTSQGRQKCLLWGLSRSEVSKSTECYKVLDSFCPADMYDMTEREGPCLQYDRDESQLDDTAQEDQKAN